MKILFVPNWVMPFGHGLCLYTLVLINKTAKDVPYVIAHEAEHVRQWKEEGFFNFIFQYFRELWKVGYKKNPYEIAARNAGVKNRFRYSKYA